MTPKKGTGYFFDAPTAGGNERPPGKKVACPLFRAWGQLLRLPNLLTVPGDPIVGFLLAGGTIAGGGWQCLSLAAAVSLMLYAAGLIQNDLAHLPEDARKRPERPLPSGGVRVRSAWVALVVLVMAAMWVAGQIGYAAASHLAFGLVVLITLYNYVTSRIRLVGPINMGLCRAVSVLLGGSAAAGWNGLTGPVPFAAMTIGLYIVTVTIIAMHETQTTAVGVRRWLPSVALMVGYPVVVFAVIASEALSGEVYGCVESVHTFLWPVAVIYALITWSWLWSVHCGHQLRGVCEPARIGGTIGLWVRALLLVQAALAASAGAEGVIFAAVLLATWPVAGLLARRFASS